MHSEYNCHCYNQILLTSTRCQASSKDLDCDKRILNCTCVFNEALVKENIACSLLWNEYSIICDLIVSLIKLWQCNTNNMISTYVQKYISGCTVCQAHKILIHPTVPAITPLAFKRSCPFQNLSVDLITDLSPINGLNSMIVMVNHGLSKGVIFTPCTKTMDTTGIASLFFNNVFKQFGLHKKIVSDCRPQFISAFVKELARLLQYNVALSLAYHPQTDGEMKCYCYRCLGPPTFFPHSVLPTVPLSMGHDNQWQKDLFGDLGPVRRWQCSEHCLLKGWVHCLSSSISFSFLDLFISSPA